MITEALQQLYGLFSRRFFFNALLPTFVFTSLTSATVVASGWSLTATSGWWDRRDLLTRLLLLLVYSALVYFLAAATSSQWRNIVRLFEGYPLLAVARRMSGPLHISQSWPWSRSPRLLAVARRMSDPLGVRWHRDRRRTLYSDARGDESLAYYLYPTRRLDDQVLPTRLGNILLAGENYANDRYGIESIYFWPRLYPLLPKEFQRDYEVSIIQYQFPLVVAFQAAVATMICSAVLLFTHAPAVVFVAALLGGTAVAYTAYNLALSSAISYAEQQRTAFDLYRNRLLMAWPSVADITDEKDAFLQIQDFVVLNLEPNWDVPHTRYVERQREAQEPPYIVRIERPPQRQKP